RTVPVPAELPSGCICAPPLRRSCQARAWRFEAGGQEADHLLARLLTVQAQVVPDALQHPVLVRKIQLPERPDERPVQAVGLVFISNDQEQREPPRDPTAVLPRQGGGLGRVVLVPEEEGA